MNTRLNMNNRLDQVFSDPQKSILSVYYTAGFPGLNDTEAVAVELEKAGVHIIEIGIPFSDPVADGPVIQASSTAALKNGMTLRLLLDQVRGIRKKVQLPIILMGYLNPVMQYGFENFCRDAAQAGVDGLILPDLPVDEFNQHYRDGFEENGLYPILLVSPTTSPDRIRKIDAITKGFIYAVSASGTTGAKADFTAEQESYFQRLSGMKLRNPFLIGFGISNPSTFQKASRFGRGAIVGSAFISFLRDTPDWEHKVGQFVSHIRG